MRNHHAQVQSGEFHPSTDLNQFDQGPPYGSRFGVARWDADIRQHPLEYLYDFSALEAAIAIVPAQVASIIGAKVVAGRAIHRWGAARAGRYLMLAIAFTVPSPLLMQPSTPAWYLVASASLFSSMGMAALTVLNTDVMGHAP